MPCDDDKGSLRARTISIVSGDSPFVTPRGTALSACGAELEFVESPSLNPLNSVQFASEAVALWFNEQIPGDHEVIPERLLTFENFINPLIKQMKQTPSKAKLEAARAKWIVNYNAQRALAIQTVIQEAYALHLNASAKEMPLVLLGGESLRNPKVAASKALMHNFGIISSGAGTPLATRGAILCENSWHIYKNDAYMTGAIRAKKDFYVVHAEGKLPKSLLWDAAHNRPRVLGREIIILLAHAYTMATSGEGLAFKCSGTDKAENATLKSAIDAVNAVKSYDDFIKVFPVEYIDEAK